MRWATPRTQPNGRPTSSRIFASVRSSTGRQMSALVETLESLASVFEELGLRWYVFGAQAAILHGVARATADIDVTIDPGAHATAEIASALASNGFVLRVAD